MTLLPLVPLLKIFLTVYGSFPFERMGKICILNIACVILGMMQLNI